MEREPKFKKKLKEIRELINNDVEKWTEDQKRAARETLNAVETAYEGKDHVDRRQS